MFVNSSELCAADFPLAEVSPLQLYTVSHEGRRTRGAAVFFLFFHIFPSFLEKKIEKKSKKKILVLRRPEDEAISLFAGLFGNPDVTLSQCTKHIDVYMYTHTHIHIKQGSTTRFG
jgi:hypothetical protein